MSEKKSLMQLSNETLELLDKIYLLEQAGEGIPEELELALSEALTNQAEKVDRASRFISYCKHQQEFLKEQKKKIDQEIRRLETHQERMKYIAGRVMDIEGVDKLTGLEGSYFSKRKSSSVSIVDENEVPGQYAVIERKFDKTQLGKDLRAGKEIPGVKLVTKTNISVK